MTQNLTQNLVNLGNRGFGANRPAELAFNHAESSLDIRPLVIMLKEGIPIEVIEVPHSIPKPIKLIASLTSFRIAFERDIGYCIYSLNCMETIACWNMLCQPILR